MSAQDDKPDLFRQINARAGARAGMKAYLKVSLKGITL